MFVLIPVVFLVAFLLGRWTKRNNRIRVNDTYIRTKKMTERSLRTQMAVKLADEIAPHIEYEKIADDVYYVTLDIYVEDSKRK